MHITLTPYTPLPYRNFNFILQLCVFTPYSYHDFIATIYCMVFTPSLFLSFRLCIILLHYFGYRSPYLSVSPFQLSVTLLFCCLCVQLVFSHLPITSFYLIFAVFEISYLPPYLTMGQARIAVLSSFYLNLLILHLDHYFCRFL